MSEEARNAQPVPEWDIRVAVRLLVEQHVSKVLHPVDLHTHEQISDGWFCSLHCPGSVR